MVPFNRDQFCKQISTSVCGQSGIPFGVISDSSFQNGGLNERAALSRSHLTIMAPNLSLPSSAPTSSRPTVGLCRRDLRLVDAASGLQGPDDPRHLVHQRHPHQHWWLARQHPFQPSARLGRGTYMPFDDNAVGPDDQQAAEQSLTHLRRGPEPLFATCRMLAGVRPSQAAKTRVLQNVSGGGARVARAMAIRGPMPCTVISRRAASFSLARRVISVSSSPSSASSCASVATRTLSVGMAPSGRPFSGVFDDRNQLRCVRCPTWHDRSELAQMPS